MTVTIDLTPQEEAWLHTQAERQGLLPAEILKGLVDERLMGSDATPGGAVQSTHTVDAENAAAIALLDSWLEADASDDPADVRRAEEEFEELQRNLNANRAEEIQRSGGRSGPA
jgi:hypothetical protein